MKDYMKEYKRWLENDNLLPEYKEELKKIENDEKEIQERFYQDLSFGTAGLRGKLGAGTNMMNTYVVQRATEALANVIINHGQDYIDKGVAIAYDCRIMSPEFAKICALVMATKGIKAYLYDSLRATPQLSYAVRYYKCAAGINITASHNPKIYNGYKVYWEEGSQIKDNIANQVLEEINKLDVFNLTKLIDEETAIKKGLLEYIGKEIDQDYYKDVMSLSLRDKGIDKDIKIVYTPLNGAGNIPVRTVLDRMGYKNVYVVKEQEMPDGTFPTVEYPNPENIKAFEYAEKLAKEVDADILIATDPDSDRLAIEVKHEGKIIPLNGNQSGVLMIDYIINSRKENGTLPKNAAVIKSIVTGEMGTQICKENNVKMINVLTGFKNIAEPINNWDTTKEYEYIFGYEESIGYNAGKFVRDKDAVSSSVILAEMAAYHKANGRTLIDVLNGLFEKYGYYSEDTVSVELDGIEGQQRIARMMKEIRNIYPKQVAGANLIEITDYSSSLKTDIKTGEKSPIDIEKTNAIKFLLDDESWFTLRPSGTEPKIKLYIYTKADSLEKSKAKVNKIKDEILAVLDTIK